MNDLAAVVPCNSEEVLPETGHTECRAVVHGVRQSRVTGSAFKRNSARNCNRLLSHASYSRRKPD
jgi:hypothetical protein